MSKTSRETRAEWTLKKEKTARDGTQVPVKKNSRGWEPSTLERKSSANRLKREVCVPIGRGLIVRAMEKDASEDHASCQGGKVNICVGESGDRWLRAEKVLCYSRLKRASPTAG